MAEPLCYVRSFAQAFRQAQSKNGVPVDIAGYVVAGASWAVIAALVGALVSLFVHDDKRKRVVGLATMWLAGVALAALLVVVADDEQKLVEGLVQVAAVLVGCGAFHLVVHRSGKHKVSAA